mmetsp:Transcript_38065/g.91340  ORF Transcript_38065/g.91340 Transcript_38065/m.91340 type:complete len:364 (+) Transcript_38065:274-1365(+)
MIRDSNAACREAIGTPATANAQTVVTSVVGVNSPSRGVMVSANFLKREFDRCPSTAYPHRRFAAACGAKLSLRVLAARASLSNTAELEYFKVPIAHTVLDSSWGVNWSASLPAAITALSINASSRYSIVANAQRSLLNSGGLNHLIRPLAPAAMFLHSSLSCLPSFAKDHAMFDSACDDNESGLSATWATTASMSSLCALFATANAHIKLAVSWGLKDGMSRAEISAMRSSRASSDTPRDVSAQAAFARSCWLKDSSCLKHASLIACPSTLLLYSMVAMPQATVVKACGLNWSMIRIMPVANESKSWSSIAQSTCTVPRAQNTLANPWALKLSALTRINPSNCLQAMLERDELGPFLDHFAIR